MVIFNQTQSAISNISTNQTLKNVNHPWNFNLKAKNIWNLHT